MAYILYYIIILYKTYSVLNPCLCRIVRHIKQTFNATFCMFDCS
jgi:hypothetical protein